jgi:hypothetical protein
MTTLARSRLLVGIDVPWVTSWSGEAVLGVGPCASVGGRLAVHQAEKAGFGRPNYSRNHLRRQRESVARMLCPMCGEPTAGEDRWLQTAHRRTAGALRARGLGAVLPPGLADAAVLVDAGSIAPCHRACAERAAAHCPHLQAHTSGQLIAFPERWMVLPLHVQAAPPAAAHVLARPAAARTAVSFLQLCGLTAEQDPDWRAGVAEPALSRG